MKYKSPCKCEMHISYGNNKGELCSKGAEYKYADMFMCDTHFKQALFTDVLSEHPEYRIFGDITIKDVPLDKREEVLKAIQVILERK